MKRKRKISLVDFHVIAQAIPMIRYVDQQTQRIRAEIVQLTYRLVYCGGGFFLNTQSLGQHLFN